MKSRLLHPIQRFVDGDSGLILAFFWGLAEALFFPILPDFYVLAVTPASPKRWWRVALFASVGSVLGGCIGFWFAFSRRSSFPLSHLPLITNGMIEQANRWVSELGAFAVLRQPLSGIPYKVFVYLSGAKRVSFVVYLWASIVARAGRIFAVAGAAAGVSSLVGERLRARLYDLFLVAFTIGFAFALRAVVESYS